MQKREPTSKINISITINPARVDINKSSSKWAKTKPKKTPIDTLPVMGYEVDLTKNPDE